MKESTGHHSVLPYEAGVGEKSTRTHREHLTVSVRVGLWRFAYLGMGRDMKRALLRAVPTQRVSSSNQTERETIQDPHASAPLVFISGGAAGSADEGKDEEEEEAEEAGVHLLFIRYNRCVSVLLKYMDPRPFPNRPSNASCT